MCGNSRPYAGVRGSPPDRRRYCPLRQSSPPCAGGHPRPLQVRRPEWPPPDNMRPCGRVPVLRRVFIRRILSADQHARHSGFSGSWICSSFPQNGCCDIANRWKDQRIGRAEHDDAGKAPSRRGAIFLLEMCFQIVDCRTGRCLRMPIPHLFPLLCVFVTLVTLSHYQYTGPNTLSGQIRKMTLPTICSVETAADSRVPRINGYVAVVAHQEISLVRHLIRQFDVGLAVSLFHKIRFVQQRPVNENVPIFVDVNPTAQGL